jgi:hypothetical protein
LRDTRRQAEEYLLLFLHEEEEKFLRSRIFALEDTLQSVDQPGVRLYGRIDRISEQEGAYTIIDYKTRVRFRRAGMIEPDGTLKSFQIPIYILLVEKTYGPVSQALYYDIHKGAYLNVFGGKKPWFDDTERDDIKTQTENAVSTMYQGIVTSNYQTPPPGERCERCELRPVCRQKYRTS